MKIRPSSSSFSTDQKDDHSPPNQTLSIDPLSPPVLPRMVLFVVWISVPPTSRNNTSNPSLSFISAVSPSVSSKPTAVLFTVASSDFSEHHWRCFIRNTSHLACV
eukprot:TRINITY_DN66607_c5_g6_i1.p2 TRINITY_DN66607_c5_g6~~TRINITY_DN66607_c5_g6_i1.p2  ORF type:complete len:105 (+),score=12.14 TRINITY_DN66607_c5_g6_i1:170-484(+)